MKILLLNQVFYPDVVATAQYLSDLAAALAERARRLAESFRRVVFAQVRISAINTALTAAYLLVALPLFDIHLPLTKTMIALTFVVGLIPVLGNLVSNTVIVVVSLAHSSQVAMASLAFLIVVHVSSARKSPPRRGSCCWPCWSWRRLSDFPASSPRPCITPT